jgi:hypothetical protein
MEVDHPLTWRGARPRHARAPIDSRERPGVVREFGHTPVHSRRSGGRCDNASGLSRLPASHPSTAQAQAGHRAHPIASEHGVLVTSATNRLSEAPGRSEAPVPPNSQPPEGPPGTAPRWPLLALLAAWAARTRPRAPPRARRLRRRAGRQPGQVPGRRERRPGERRDDGRWHGEANWKAAVDDVFRSLPDLLEQGALSPTGTLDPDRRPDFVAESRHNWKSSKRSPPPCWTYVGRTHTCYARRAPRLSAIRCTPVNASHIRASRKLS